MRRRLAGAPGSRPVTLADLDGIGDSADRDALLNTLGIVRDSRPRYVSPDPQWRGPWQWWWHIADEATGRVVYGPRRAWSRTAAGRRKSNALALATGGKLPLNEDGAR